MSQQETQKKKYVTVPDHLKQFIVEQHYEEYTPIDHAVWRYVMRQNHHFLGARAHGAYMEGLNATGMSIERIPSIEYMNDCLSNFGWGAATIDGFIPPEAFMDFQAHGILAISADIRTDEHIAYTPAPDIIHESAGHAPIIYNDKYREYLKLIGQIGAKALSSKEEFEVYEAIRRLSILKEDPNSDPNEVREAEEELVRKQDANTTDSEATQVSRLYWWTVEYGLIGEVNQPQIFGAGLLSSVGESQSCLQDDVKKIPFSLDCIHTSYDITKKQPQLFVCKDFDQLIEAVQEFSKTLAQSVGGTESLVKALQSENLATYVYSSGLQVSGVISELIYDEGNEAVYIRTQGPTALAYQDQELTGHGTDYHHHGFGSPVGKLKGMDKPIEELTDEELISIGLVKDKKVEIEFQSGVKVSGIVKDIVRQDNKILFIAFDQCTVIYGDRTLFESAWGTYEMAVGARIVSVFAGSADKRSFLTGTSKPSDLKTQKRTYSERELKRHRLYQAVRDLREKEADSNQIESKLKEIYPVLQTDYASDWLIRLEMVELLAGHQIDNQLRSELELELSELANQDEERGKLIWNGMNLVKAN